MNTRIRAQLECRPSHVGGRYFTTSSRLLHSCGAVKCITKTTKEYICTKTSEREKISEGNIAHDSPAACHILGAREQKFENVGCEIRVLGVSLAGVVGLKSQPLLLCVIHHASEDVVPDFN